MDQNTKYRRADIFSSNLREFISIAEGEIGALCNVLRNFNQSKNIERIFLTGVLPVTMDTAVSGFVSVKLSDRPEVNCLAGFTDDEVLELLKETVDFSKCLHTPEALREVMKCRYAGYRFAKTCKDTVYNAALCLNFISELRSLNYDIPKFRLISGDDADYTRLSGYLNLMTEHDEKKLTAALIKKRPVECALPVTVKITSPNARLDMSQGISLLYHQGFLTMMSADEVTEYCGKSVSSTFVKTPNYYISMLFERHALEKAHIPWNCIENQSRISELARDNDLAAVLSLLKSIAPTFVHTDVSREAEY
ncbi:AAA family ATPase, partial [Succinimonas sp.]|uniref:AAA family ATPase n=1 Tax=Succinimonas sp. TaxID=1936151 RepID=UPI003869DC4F